MRASHNIMYVSSLDGKKQNIIDGGGGEEIYNVDYIFSDVSFRWTPNRCFYELRSIFKYSVKTK